MAAIMPEDQLIELLLQLKKTTPDQARAILNSQPQIAFGLVELMHRMGAIKPETLQATLAAQQLANAPAPAPVPVAVAPPHQPTPPPVAAGYAAYNNPPQPPAPVAPAQPPQVQLPPAFEALPEEQKAMIRSVLSMTPEQINLLGPNERAGIMQLRAQLGL
ncbi:unnamed protein product [Peniophora sp. CBMAI 1063]|nr:unnamed protein product [Peniophora sp. CBMAI 1063]